MRTWLTIAGGVDRVNERVAHAVKWLILVMTLVSALNAVSRKAFSLSSNALLEAQWYLFAAVFLLAAGHTLQSNAHVRIDILAARFAPRTRLWVEIAATLLFLLPFSLLVLRLGWTYFLDSVENREISLNAGGLPIWPVKLLIPAGFALLLAQGLAQVIKAWAALRGQLPQDAPFSAAEPAAPRGATAQ